MKKFWSSGLAKTGAGGNAIPYTLSLNQANAFTNARIFLNFLTSQQTNLLPARNIVPYVDYPQSKYIGGEKQHAMSMGISHGKTFSISPIEVQ